MDTVTNDRPAQHSRIMLGVLITAVGVLMLVDRLDLAEVHVTSRLWPLLPLGLGLLRVIDPPVVRKGGCRTRRTGMWLVFIGCWGLMNEFHVWGFDYHNSWPLVVIFAGVNMVWRSVEAPPVRPRDERQQP